MNYESNHIRFSLSVRRVVTLSHGLPQIMRDTLAAYHDRPSQTEFFIGEPIQYPVFMQYGPSLHNTQSHIIGYRLLMSNPNVTALKLIWFQWIRLETLTLSYPLLRPKIHWIIYYEYSLSLLRVQIPCCAFTYLHELVKDPNHTINYFSRCNQKHDQMIKWSKTYS